MQFALSTHLFHGERLTRHHLESARAAGFTDLEIFATRTHFDYASEAAVTEYAALLRDVGLNVGSIALALMNGVRGVLADWSSIITGSVDLISQSTRLMAMKFKASLNNNAFNFEVN